MQFQQGGAIDVLHVEDDAGLADVVGTFLERHDDRLSVEAETDPAVALDRIDEESFDCVVSDYDMPGLTGLDLLREVRESYPDLPFVLFTGKGSEEIASEAISAGVTDYLQKGGTEKYEVLANRITNAVEGAEAERHARRGYRALDAAWDGIAILDEDGRFAYVNDAYAETFGRDRGALTGSHWASLYPENEAERIRDEILPAVVDGGTWTGEKRILVGEDDDGEPQRTVAHAVAGTADGDVVCVIRDVTDRHELRRVRERFQLLVEEVEDYAIFTLDADGYIESWNPGAERIKGYDRSEIVGEHYSTLFPEEAVEEGVPEQLLSRAAERGSVEDTGWRLRADGSRFWADVVVTALYEDGRLRGYGKVTRDATAEKDREDRRRRDDAYREKLQKVTADQDLGFQEKVVELLRLGSEYLDVENGHLVRIDPSRERHEVVAVSDEHPSIENGDVSSLSNTYCRKTIREEGSLAVHDAVEQGWGDDPAYGAYQLGCYVGTRLEVGGEVYGTLCFADRAPRKEPFRREERSFVEALGKWVAHELFVQRHEAERAATNERIDRVGHLIRNELKPALGAVGRALESGTVDEDPGSVAEPVERATRTVELLATLTDRDTAVETERVDLQQAIEDAWTNVASDDVRMTVEDTGTITAERDRVVDLFEALFRTLLAADADAIRTSVEDEGIRIEGENPAWPDDPEALLGPDNSRVDPGSLGVVQDVVTAHGWTLSVDDAPDGVDVHVQDIDYRAIPLR